MFGESIEVAEKKCVAKGDKLCEFRFASSFALYAEEALKIRNQMISEMAVKYY